MNNLALKNHALRADLGQVWTPEKIANKMVITSKKLLEKNNTDRFTVLDPACGPATFPKALLKNYLPIQELDCHDIDPKMINITVQFLSGHDVSHNTKTTDYLLVNNKKKYDLVILNPPYIRHESFDLSYKNKIRNLLSTRSIRKINGRSNIFIYFLYKSLTDLSNNGIMCAIIYDSIIHSQYGKEFWSYIEKNYYIEQLEQIKAPFVNTLIDASIIFIRNKKEKKSTPPKKRNKSSPALKKEMTYLSNLLEISRGTTFPSRKIFIPNEKDNFYPLAKPIIMKPKDRNSLILTHADSHAYFYGLHEKLDIHLKRISKKMGVREQVMKQKKGWILFNYYIRNEPKHFYNSNNLSVSDNFYVSFTKDEFPDMLAWLLLNSSIYKKNIVSIARNQGSGLKKLQVYEYKSAIVHDWRKIDLKNIEYYHAIAKKLILSTADHDQIKQVADKIVKEIF